MKRLGLFCDKEDAPKKSKIENKRWLSYGNMKEILEVMDPSVRFEVFRTIPSARVANNLLPPLSLDFLSFGAMGITINNITRQFGIIREFHPGHEMTQKIRTENQSGGTRYDMDEFGIEERAETRVHLEFNRLQTRTEKMAELRTWKMHLEMCTNPELANKYKSEIFPLQLMKNNRPGPYDSFIQYTKSFKGSKDAVVFKKSYQPGSKAMFPEYKKLVYDFLDGRGPIIPVKKLEFSKADTIIPLPPNVKFKIRELVIEEKIAFIFDQLLPFIDESSFPLEVLETREFTYTNLLDRPAVQSAKLLVLKDHNDFDDLVHQFDMFRNIWVHCVEHVDDEEQGHCVLACAELIQTWLEEPPAIGTRVTFGCHNERFLLEKMDVIKERFNLSEEGSFTIPMTAEAQIQVDSKLMDPSNPSSYGQSHMISMEIVSVQQE